MKLRVVAVIEAAGDDISKVIQTLSEELDLWSISVEPVEGTEEK